VCSLAIEYELSPKKKNEALFLQENRNLPNGGLCSRGFAKPWYFPMVLHIGSHQLKIVGLLRGG
jgi:hypothetical protein